MTYFFKKPFAENGDITNIPTNPQGDGGVSYQEGWPEGYELDMQTNPDEAKNLSRTNFNGLFFNITDALKTLQIFGCNPYITASDNDGVAYPYPEGGMCYYTDPATGEVGVYRSLQSNNTEVPSTNGVTNSLWRREFDVALDTLKSNRVSNCVLYYASFPTYTTDNNAITITIAAGTKILTAKGINSNDGTLNNEIFQLLNTETVTYSFTGEQVNKYVFVTENNELLLLDTQNYNQYNNLDMVNQQLDGVTDYDIYYFDTELNKWQFRRAGSENFIDLSYSMVNICSFTGASTDNIVFSYIDPLMLISSETFNNKMSSIQPAIETSRYITLTNTPGGKQIMDINLPSTATPFCVNSGNIDGSGNANLMSSDSIVLPNLKTDMVYPTSGTITSNFNIFSASNVNNVFTPNGGICSTYFAYNYGSLVESNIATMTFYNPIELSTLGCVLQTSVWQYGTYSTWESYEVFYAYNWFLIDLFFDDGTSLSINCRDYVGYGYWGSINIDLATYAAAGKKITKIAVRIQGQMYDMMFGSWAWQYSAASYIKGIRIINTVNDVEYSSNQISFKVGSNYYEKLSAAATPMLSSEVGTITNSTPNRISDMWFENNMALIPSYIDGFRSTFVFNSTPAETDNARLVLRYKDTYNNQYLGGLKIVLEYWGGATYTVVENKILYESQDLIFEIPNGKYIKSVTVSAAQTDFLNEVYIGKIQIYNGVPSATISALEKYPVLQFTAADTDRSHFTLMNIAPLSTDVSGYVMVSQEGAYILPGTNVIRKQKAQPTFASDPALREGDIWLDYSKEPLISYQYNKGQWEIIKDVPIGYVELLWSSPSTSASVAGTGITSASVTTSTFAQAVAGTGIYTFVYDGAAWYLGGDSVTLSDYGISYSGTAALNDSITVTYTASSATVNTLTTYEYNQNGYDVNTFTTISGALSGRDGRDGQNGRDGKNGAPGAKGDPGVGVIPGGRTGELLAKASNADYSMKWTTAVSNALFDGGQAGMTLIKNSSTDLDFSWGTIQSLPNGGETGMALVKDSNNDFDVSWQNIQILPAGGLPNQVLGKLSGADYNVGWINPGGGVSQASLRKMDFKTTAYFQSSINGYTNLLLEQFIGLDGINVSDRATVTPYYSTIEANIENLSGDVLAFRLIGVSFSQLIDYMQVLGDYTGTVTFKYSIDNGSTFVNFPENEMLQVSTNSLILKVEMAAAAVLDNIAIFVK